MAFIRRLVCYYGDKVDNPYRLMVYIIALYGLYAIVFLLFIITKMRQATTNQQEDTIKIKVQVVGNVASEFTMPVDTTVAEALEIAGLAQGSNCSVGGQKAYNEDFLDDGDLLLVEAKGNGFGA